MSSLFTKIKKEYGGDYQNHLLEQYRLYIESIERISDRRQQANNYFIAINTTLISIIGITLSSSYFANSEWLKVIIATLGLIICVIFWYLIRSYKQLNTGKFRVLHEIETELPLSLYKYEWEILGKGKKKKIYYPFSHVELLIPWVFGLVYAVLIYIFYCR